MGEQRRKSPAGWQPRKPPTEPVIDAAKSTGDAQTDAEATKRAVSTDAHTAPVPDVRREPDGLERVTGLATVAASAYLHAGSWALSQSLRASKRVAGAMTSPAKAATLADDVVRSTREVLQAIMAAGSARGSIGDGVKTAAGGPTNVAVTEVEVEVPSEPPPDAGPAWLRNAGDELLRRSRDLDSEPAIHPAYARILSELAPDEGRVLQLMLVGGPQPAVDIRGGGIFGLINAQVVRRGLTMIGARAGLRHVDQVPSYLNNLFRLGLIWVSPETIRDYRRYQVLEAQPEVIEAMHTVRHARVVRRSIHLTPFGEDFARTTLPAGVARELPPHSDPATPETERPTEPVDDPFA